MIYTITLSPCADHYVTAEAVPGKTNRAARSRIVFGGKGINVSIALKNLGLENKALFFAGGFTGDGLISDLTAKGVKYLYVKTESPTRINTKIISDNGVTEINAPPGKVSGWELGRFLSLLSEIRKLDTVVISGSAPECATDIVRQVLSQIRDTGAKLICDMHGEDLKKCLEYKPYLIKPNLEEAAEFFGVTPDYCRAEEYVKELGKYSKYAILSLGGSGAYMCKDGKTEYVPVIDPGLGVKNPVGAGDSMIAGFLYAEAHKADRLVCAVSAGSATAYSDGICDIKTFEEIKRLYR